MSVKATRRLISGQIASVIESLNGHSKSVSDLRELLANTSPKRLQQAEKEGWTTLALWMGAELLCLLELFGRLYRKNLDGSALPNAIPLTAEEAASLGLQIAESRTAQVTHQAIKWVDLAKRYKPVVARVLAHAESSRIGGRKSGKNRKSAANLLHAKIVVHYKRLVAQGTANRDVAGILAQRHKLSPTHIRTILRPHRIVN